MSRIQILLLLALAVLPGCLDTRDEIQAEEERRTLQGQVTTLQRTNSDQVVQVQELHEEIRSLRGRVEATEAQLTKVSGKQDTGEAEDQKQTAELNNRMKVLTEAVASLQTQMAQLEQHQQDLSAALQTAVAAMNEQNTKIKRDTSSVKGSFDTGSAEFDKKNWKKAIVAFESYRSSNPKGKHYAAATLKIGQSFQELGLKKEASAFFEEVVQKFPKSDEAKKATHYLKR